MRITPLCNFASYNSRVASKKGAIGFDSSCHLCSRRPQFLSARLAAFTVFELPVMAARMGGRKPCRFSPEVPGLSTRPSCRPRLTAGAAVLAKPHHLEAFNG